MRGHVQVFVFPSWKWTFKCQNRDQINHIKNYQNIRLCEICKFFLLFPCENLMLLGKCFRPHITVTLSCTRRRGAQNKWRMKRAGLNKVGVQYDRHGGVKEMWWEKDCFAVMTDPVMVGLWFTQVHVGTFFKASAAYCDSDVLIWVFPPPPTPYFLSLG